LKKITQKRRTRGQRKAMILKIRKRKKMKSTPDLKRTEEKKKTARRQSILHPSHPIQKIGLLNFTTKPQKKAST